MKPNIEKLEVGMKFKNFKQLVIFTEMATLETYQGGGTNLKSYEQRLIKAGVRFEHKIENGHKKHELIITEIK